MPLHTEIAALAAVVAANPETFGSFAQEVHSGLTAVHKKLSYACHLICGCEGLKFGLKHDGRGSRRVRCCLKGLESTLFLVLPRLPGNPAVSIKQKPIKTSSCAVDSSGRLGFPTGNQEGWKYGQGFPWPVCLECVLPGFLHAASPDVRRSRQHAQIEGSKPSSSTSRVSINPYSFNCASLYSVIRFLLTRTSWFRQLPIPASVSVWPTSPCSAG